MQGIVKAPFEGKPVKVANEFYQQGPNAPKDLRRIISVIFWSLEIGIMG